MNPGKLFLFMALSAFLASCEDDPVTPTCGNYAVNLGPFYLEQSSKSVFPYSDADSILVFRNQFDEELKLTRSFSFLDTFSFTLIGECPFDTAVEIPYLIALEQMGAFFINDSLELSAQFSFQAAYRANNEEVTGESDIFNLSLRRLVPGNATTVSAILTYKSGEMLLFFNRYFQSLTLGSKTFNNVYSNFTIPQNPPEFLVYMNADQGIVGFEETATGKVWVFERIE